LDGCANALTGLGDNGKAKSASWSRGPGASPESLEQMRPIRFGDAGAVIHDTKSSVTGKSDGDLRARRLMTDCILDEIAGDLGDCFLGGEHLQGLAFLPPPIRPDRSRHPGPSPPGSPWKALRGPDTPTAEPQAT
jgi:hypothetical protein